MLKALKPTADYKNNLENLLADVVNYAREYTDKSVDEIKNAAVSPDAVSLPEVETALSGHDISVDEATVKRVADALHKQISALMKDYLTSAAREVEETGAANGSFEQLVKPWGVRIFNAMDNLKLNTPTKPEGEAEGPGAELPGVPSVTIGDDKYIKTDRGWQDAKTKELLDAKLSSALDAALNAEKTV
jgi:hypothetical protein